MERKLTCHNLYGTKPAEPANWIGKKVRVSATTEYDTIYNCKIGFVVNKPFPIQHPDFYDVSIIGAGECLFHESQLTLVE